jgi:acyl-CoA thioesterase
MSKPSDISMSPFGNFLGIEVLEFDKGRSKCCLHLKDHHFNNGGRVHGGVLTSLADTAAAVAVRSVRPQGKLSATTDMNIAFIRPPQGQSLEAVAEVIHTGRRLFRTEIAVYSAEKLVAKANATFMIVDGPQTKSVDAP